jgi:hypothetical protein
MKTAGICHKESCRRRQNPDFQLLLTQKQHRCKVSETRDIGFFLWGKTLRNLWFQLHLLYFALNY